MPRESRAEKALRYIAEERVTVTSANEHGIRLSVRGSRAEPYEVVFGRNSAGRVIATCTCEAVADRCSHVAIARLLHRI